MQLYAGTSKQFIADATQHRIAEKLKDSFFREFRREPSKNEYRSWQNSLQAMCLAMMQAELTDHGVILEYQLPLSSLRLDCMLTGVDVEKAENAVIVELKQWDAAISTSVDGVVATFVGGDVRPVLHPSVQVAQYQQYLSDVHTVFQEGGVGLASCAYLHNLQFDPGSELFAPRHTEYISRAPLFTGDQSPKLAEFLNARLSLGQGDGVLAKVLQSRYRPSKKLLTHTAQMVKGQSQFVLLDEQLVVFNSVVSTVKEAFHGKGKVVFLVQGGPGTGKSVVALNLMGALAGHGYNAQHATGSKAFTGNIRRLVGARASNQFKFFSSYTVAEESEIDVLILDEAHRIRSTSAFQYLAKEKRSGLPQVEELIRAAKVSVFFIDDLQIVRPKEVGSADLIRRTALEMNCDLREFELDAQFRCGGSDGFVNWVDNTLSIRRTANVLWDNSEGIDFQIVEDIQGLEALIRKRNTEGNSARLTAGFCWPWSDPSRDGQLVNDVVVGEWSMPWNARGDKGILAPGIPKSDFWASDPNGINQVGCVYTAQGFEYDYCGLIWGPDLRYDPKVGDWIGDKSQSHDTEVKRSGDDFVDLVKQTYRVLLTRGMKGVYVYFMDRDTENFVRSRLERGGDPFR